MLQQLTWSLRSLAVSDVTMTVSGLPLQVADTGGINPDISPQYEAIGSDGKSFGALTTGGVTAFPGLGAQVMSLGPTAATLSHDRGVAAVLGGSGVSIVGATANPVLVDPRTGSVAPSLDPDGYAWSDPPGDPSALVAVKSDAKQHMIPIPVSGRVVSLAVSRDGTRLLVALSTDSGPRLVVTGIQRDKDDAPVGFGPLVDLPVGGGALLGATWLDANSVAALSSGTDGATDVVEYAISGQTTPHGSGSRRAGDRGRQRRHPAAGLLRQRAAAEPRRGMAERRLARLLPRHAAVKAVHRLVAAAAPPGAAAPCSGRARDALLDAIALLLPVECSGCGAPDRELCDACRALLQPRPIARRLADGTPVVAGLEYDGTARAAIVALKQGRTALASALVPALVLALDSVADGRGDLELCAGPADAACAAPAGLRSGAAAARARRTASRPPAAAGIRPYRPEDPRRRRTRPQSGGRVPGARRSLRPPPPAR